MYPDVSMAHGALSDDYVRKKNFATALKEFQLNLMMDERREFAASIGQAYTASGYQGVFKKEIEFYQVLGANYDSSAVACAYADLDDKDRAFQWLNKAYDHFLLFIKAAQCFDSLHGDPRYTQILRKMGLPE